MNNFGKKGAVALTQPLFWCNKVFSPLCAKLQVMLKSVGETLFVINIQSL